MKHHWLVAGVGRSGTTAIYEALQNSTHPRQGFSYFYEPYLWGPPTWSPRFRDVRKAFATTDSIHAYGLRCHLATPLFASDVPERSTYHTGFVDSLFKENGASLVKIIRGCGRLKDYLELVPDLKIVFVIRNPLDCVNSVLGNFSFFGDEFHPSDLPRFRQELETLGRPQPSFSTECEAATAWWYEMNQAALRGIEAHRDRVFIAPYEAYVSSHNATSELLAAFLSLDTNNVSMISLDKPVGSITRKNNLRTADRDHILPFNAAYFDLIEQISNIPIEGGPQSARERTCIKYKDLNAGAFTPDVPRNASPLLVRALLRQEREGRQIVLGGIRQASESLRRVEMKFSVESSRRS